MSEPQVREVGHIDTDDGTISVGVDFGTVAVYIGGWLSADGVRLRPLMAEDFARMFVAACWEAEQQKDTHTDAQRAELRAAAEEMADCQLRPFPIAK